MQTSNEPLFNATATTETAEHESATAVHHGHPDHRLFGFTLFLISEGMLFVGLFVAYLAFRAVATEWPPEGLPELEFTLPFINTLILISSSFVIHQAEGLIKKNDIQGVRLWLGITAFMGAVFLAGQAYEYSIFLSEGFTLQSGLYGGTFYVLTGFHGLHVLIGLIMILTVLARSLKPGHYSAQKHFGIQAASLYWHFVDVVWIVLFLLLYVAR